MKSAVPVAGMLLFTVAANAQTGSLDGIITIATGFVTWFQIFAGILGVAAIIWGAINMYFTHLERGMGKVIAGILGLLIAGNAHAIVNAFYSQAG